MDLLSSYSKKYRDLGEPLLVKANKIRNFGKIGIAVLLLLIVLSTVLVSFKLALIIILIISMFVSGILLEEYNKLHAQGNSYISLSQEIERFIKSCSLSENEIKELDNLLEDFDNGKFTIEAYNSMVTFSKLFAAKMTKSNIKSVEFCRVSDIDSILITPCEDADHYYFEFNVKNDFKLSLITADKDNLIKIISANYPDIKIVEEVG